jgi:hypothetical protein
MGDPDTIRQFLASNEFSEFATADMPTADSAWHHWLQPKYDQAQRRKWLEAHRKFPFRREKQADMCRGDTQEDQRVPFLPL